MWFHCISWHPLSGLCLHHGRFSSCYLSFPTQASCRDWRDFPQAHPCLDLESETALHNSVCVALSPPDGVKNKSCSPSRAGGLFGLSPREPLPHLAAGFSSSPPGVLVLPADSQPTWPQVLSLLSDVIPLVPLTVLYVPVSTSCFNSLATGSPW